MCVQKLLQCKCPVDSTDLQGRTALHDAAYAGCKTAIKMLCDGGASIDAVDADGRSPLLLAAKMSQPGACQMLVQYGARSVLRDKQNKTALILACESSCKEAADILLKTKADVSAVDLYGHDAYHYARLSQKQDLITLVQYALEKNTKAKETATVSQKIQQAKPLSTGTGRTKAGSVKTEKPLSEPLIREHGSHSAEGKGAKQSQNLDSTQVRPTQAAPVPVRSAPMELLPGEVEALRRELRDSRRRQEAAEAEVHRLDTALALRAQEYEGLRRSSEQALHAAHKRSWELEEALGEVQRRMAGSETRVRQMQAHLVAVREHLVEELRVQLQEVKGQREAAVAELGRMQKELIQSRREVEQQKENQSSLMQELSRLSHELLCREEQMNTLRTRLAEVETQQAEMLCKEAQTPSEWCRTHEESTMTDLTTENPEPAVDLENYINKNEHTVITSSLKDALQQAETKADEALEKFRSAQEENQNLLRELQEQKSELDTIQEALQARFVPVALVQEKEKEVERLKLALEKRERRQNQASVNISNLKDEGVQTEEHRQPWTSEVQQNQVSSSTGSDRAECEVTRRAVKNTQPSGTESKNSTNEDQGSRLQDQVEKSSVELEGQKLVQVNISEPTSSCDPSQSDSSLQAQVHSLQQQLEDCEKHYRHVLSIYRTRLLSAAQGYMDEEARVALLQIAKMREECVC
ncbi:uveal autoantigen with coiled-coil domains and ankyrin repeats isoform X2 [Puntigrus tetrazona]|nr:uveal autoantigen with coiled-coil domains and ankyrin repeats isoform X2 [Puntigrus tetrazona]XP_043072461.1 uveal autoantigen with coiled-coil domains and ankyrin repeats isoform X2 [Puntigrus tetrazona]XP_043072462.1 uveal autoantigen with coiled-coil domains and ankyrin repeats isoform X2 [Puntigrus tetrazona]XP_043072463.1 uveal autoantigen with coiled-coil domains and ankyrin repeats isoform X2 [Puntigrus tetrazona]